MKKVIAYKDNGIGGEFAKIFDDKISDYLVHELEGFLNFISPGDVLCTCERNGSSGCVIFEKDIPAGKLVRSYPLKLGDSGWEPLNRYPPTYFKKTI